MKTNLLIKAFSIGLMATIGIMTSCQDDERLTAEDTLSISEEAISEGYFEDSDDVSSIVVFDTENPSGGRASANGRISSDDARVNCATLSFTENSNAEAGQITIDFSANDLGYCLVNGNKRQGKIILTYSNGPRTEIGFTVVVTFDAYKINGIELKGTRTIVKVEPSAEANIKHSISLTNGQAIWPDNAGSVTRSSEFTREWVRDAVDERIVLEGEASGTTRRGKSYSMTIDEALVYRRACIVTDGIYMATKGTKVFTTDKKQIAIGYGDGSCDRSISITVDGVTRNLNVGNN